MKRVRSENKEIKIWKNRERKVAENRRDEKKTFVFVTLCYPYSINVLSYVLFHWTFKVQYFVSFFGILIQ